MTNLEKNLPHTLTLVRHGLSEANIFQAKGVFPDGRKVSSIPEEFGSRHDSFMRLSEHGIGQAKAAGEWLKKWAEENIAAGGFNRFYVSPHVRTRETAAHLGLNGRWRVDDRWRERDWGRIAALSRDEQWRDWRDIMMLKEQNEWYWQPPSGESLATGVRTRFNAIMDMLYRRPEVDSVIAVTHGELIRVAQFVIEQMTPEQWIAMDADKQYKVQNCMVLQYTRIDPETGEKSNQFTHRRAVCPWDESKSWNNGQWVKVGYQLFSDEELLAGVDKYPRLLIPDGDTSLDDEN